MAHDHCHCRDYTRSQLLHSAAAQAGKGLPGIENGMPAPAGTGLSRRKFLLRSAGLALSVYGATKLPISALQEGIAQANPTDKVLVSIFFDGGIDALNVMAPINDPLYHTQRPTLGSRAACRWPTRCRRVTAASTSSSGIHRPRASRRFARRAS